MGSETDDIVAIDLRENFPQGRTRDLVAEKLGIGSGKQYEKEKYIADKGQDLERVIESIILYGYTLGIETYKEIGNHQVRYKVK